MVISFIIEIGVCLRNLFIVFFLIFKNQFAFSEDGIQAPKLISNINKIMEHFNNLEKYGFEVELEPKDSGRKVKVFGVINNLKPNESWFIAVDRYLLNMPIEGYVDGEYFLLNAKESCITKIKKCSFSMTFKPNDNKVLEGCLSIKENSSDSFFQLISPETSLSEVMYVNRNKNLDSIVIKKKEINLSYTFMEEKLISTVAFYESLECRFTSNFYYDLNKLLQIKEITKNYLEFAHERKYVKYEDLDIANNKKLRILLIRILSIRTKFLDIDIIEPWAIKTFNCNVNTLLGNYSNIRNLFSDYIFSDIDLLQKWIVLLQIEN